MGLLVLQFLCLVLEVCVVASSLVIQGSAGYNVSSLPSTFAGDPVIGHGMSNSVTRWKPLRSNAPSLEFQPKWKDTHLLLPPRSSAPVPQTNNDVLPSVSPPPSRTLSPHSSAPFPTNSQNTAKSLPPSAPQGKPRQNEVPFLAPKASVPVPLLSSKSPQKALTIHHVMPKSTPPSSGQKKGSDVAAPIFAPVYPVNDAQAPKEMPANPPYGHPIMPETPSSVQPVSGTSSPSKLPRISPYINHIFHSEPSSKSPEPHFLPAPTPIISGTRTYDPVAAPTHGIFSQISPMIFPPTKARSMPKARRHVPYAPPPLFPPKSPPNIQYHTPMPLPSNSVHGHYHKVKNISSPAPSYLVPPTASVEHGPSMHPAPLYPPKLDPKSRQRQHVTSPPNPEPHFLPAPTPIISGTRTDNPVAAPAHARSMPKARRHIPYAPSPLFPPKSPPNVQYHTPIPLPSNSVHGHYHKVKNISSPAPSFLVPPTASAEQGPSMHPAPLYPPKLDPKSRRRQHVASPPNPGHVSPAPSPSTKSPSGQIKVPFLPPKTRRSGSLPRNPKATPPPPILALPPPPPNEDCASLTCTEPLTNTPPGTPCSCVWPMQVGLHLSVAVYTFFPLVSELAKEIAIGVFMRLSQVRIMGANAASEDAEKTIVLLNLVPLGERFDSTTAYLAYQRFWDKKVAIKASFFGDYEVLYVRYPGLPPSPPLPPSSINIINSGPYSGHDNNGTMTKPLGVDVRRRQHKSGLNGSVIVIIVLSASVAMILCCAVVCIFLFKRREHICQPAATPQTTLLSNAKSSGIPASITRSGPSYASLSFGSSIAYTGSAKKFSSSEIERATDNFNVLKILGEGGFGRVYSGILEDRTKVAIKVLKRYDQQGSRGFLAEVEMLSRLHHRNLVKLIGICTEDRICCLVYELIPNGSVESHLHGVDKETAPLDWSSRIKIALGAARGLAYLHEDSCPPVIHRDFKSSNILLEYDFTPKVSDFGLARTALDEENSHISTRVMGTFGYVAPEYAMTGHLLVKSDVYSYGVVLLELLTGRKPVDMSQPTGQENLVSLTRPLLTSKQGLEAILDPSLGPDFPFDCIAKVAAIASMCVQAEVSHRPLMSEVVQALKLVCNDSDETKEMGSRSCSREELSIDMEDRISTTSDHLADPLQKQSPLSIHGIDVERGIPVSEIFSSWARYGRQGSGSFRRHSSSGPLQTGKIRHLWERMRGQTGGSVREHGLMFKLWSRSN